MPFHIVQATDGTICGVWSSPPTFEEQCLGYAKTKGIDPALLLSKAEPLPVTVTTQDLEPPREVHNAPLPFYVVSQATVMDWTKATPLPRQAINEYQESRPHILEDGYTDIWQPNCRSDQQQWKDFSLFENVTAQDAASDPNVVIVFPTFLELFVSANLQENVATCIKRALDMWPNNRIVFQYNHDDDAALQPCFKNLPPRVFIVNFNTSRPTSNDILVPFWTINTELKAHPKTHKAGFIGYVGGIPCRRDLRNAMAGRDGYYFLDTSSINSRLPESRYLDIMGTFKFALCPRGGGLNSYRFYESIHCGAVPVLFADKSALPYPDLHYPDFCVKLKESDARNFAAIDSALAMAQWPVLWKNLMAVRERFSLLGVQREIYMRLRRYVG